MKEEILVKEIPKKIETHIYLSACIHTRKARASLGSSLVNTAVDKTASQLSALVWSNRRKTRLLGSSVDDFAAPKTFPVHDRYASCISKIKEKNTETLTLLYPIRKSARKSVASKYKSAGTDASAKKRNKRD